jgi:electron transfer flavoprotein beta subunit
MKIVVCVKQVPEISNVRINPETGTLIREGVASILNPFCEYALDLAVHLKKESPGTEIIAVSMGPPQTRSALMRCLELGADRAILASDRKFAGADTWATGKTLAAVIKAAVPDFNLILVGKQAIDGDTAQVGPEIAEFMGLPQVMYGVAAEFGKTRKRIRVRREVESGYEVVEMRLPGVVSASKGSLIRRLPSLKAIINARSKPLETLTAADLDIDDSHLGLEGSLTQVVRIFPPQSRADGRKLEGLDSEGARKAILAFLQAQHYVEGGQPSC